MKDNKLKVLVFVNEFCGNTLTFIYNEVIELSKNTYVKVLTRNRKNEILFPFENVLTYKPQDNKFYHKIKKTLQNRNYFFAFRDNNFRSLITHLMDEFKPDIIHLHFGFEAFHFLKNMPIISNIPIFISFHGYDASHKLNSSLYVQNLKKILLKNNIVPIFVSNYMKKHVERKLGLVLNKSLLLYYGTDSKLFKREIYNANRNKIVFLQVSSFTEKKGHEYTIRAFDKFLKEMNHSKDFQLILAGSGDLLEKMKSLVKELGIEKQVSFPGLVNKEQVKKLMENSNIFMHHSITSKSVGDMEGIPNAIMEAMAMELPILSTLHAGIPELVENNVNGILVEEGNVDEYCKAMHKIKDWKYLDINRLKIMEKFELESHGRILYNYYINQLQQKL